ncbi:MAG: Tad domain-containing protein [Acidimicrobiia bacterium]|nr:Tad domain-containing protein [Acidimicrobiia bacterium]
MTARRFWNPRARSHHERGFILVWFTVMLVVLLAIGGLAVDLGRWYVESQRTQRAADAAAMAGVVHRSPAEDFSADPRWSSVAATVAEANGYSNNVSPGTPLSDTGDVRVEASTRSCTGPGNDEDCVELPRNQLKVTVETRIPNLFATLVGLDTHNVRRSAIAEYQGEVQMGSPTNVLGNEPVAAGETRWTNGDPAQQPGFWLNVNGPRTYLANGEPYQGNDCRVVAFPEGVGPDRADGCDGTGQNRFYEYPTDVLGGESGRDGYLYTIRARGTQPGETLRVQLFDPVWTPQGSACTSWQYSDIYNHVVAYKDASPVSGWPGVLPSPRGSRSTSTAGSWSPATATAGTSSSGSPTSSPTGSPWPRPTP